MAAGSIAHGHRLYYSRCGYRPDVTRLQHDGLLQLRLDHNVISRAEVQPCRAAAQGMRKARATVAARVRARVRMQGGVETGVNVEVEVGVVEG